jgi:hypothetical protein
MADAIDMQCALDAENTGVPDCPVDLNRIAAFLLLPKGKSYTPAQTANGEVFLAALQADLYNVNKAQRIYLVTGINNFEAANTDATTETSGYGDIRTLLDTKIGATLTIWNGGACYFSSLMAFSRKQGSYTLMWIDIDGVVAGTKIKRGASAGNMTGYDLNNLYFPPRAMATAAAGVMQQVNIAMADGYNQFGKNWMYVKTDNAATDLKGINTIQLVDITSTISPTPGTGVYHIKVLSGCGTQNLVPLYGTILDTITQGTVWTSINNTDEGVINISSITIPPGDDPELIFTFDTTDTDWAAGEDVLLSMVDTEDLATALMVGFEANPTSLILLN